MENLIKGFKAW